MKKNNEIPTPKPSPAIKKKKIINLRFFAFFVPVLLLTIFSASCSNDSKDSSDQDVVNETSCKDYPLHLVIGTTVFDFVYNSQNKPVKLLTKIKNIKAPLEDPIKTTYTVDYSAQGKPSKISKTIGDKLEKYYLLDYNVNGVLIKQSEYNPEGVITTYTTAEYDTKGLLIKITSHTDNNGKDNMVTTTYEYANGNLFKKNISNLYLPNTDKYHNLEFIYTYYQDKETKIKPFFEGLSGLCFIANVAGSRELQYLPRENSDQIFYFLETSVNKNMLKDVRINSDLSNLQAETSIDYSYTYDNEGYPTVQKGILATKVYSSVPTQFGVPLITTSDYNNPFEKTVNYFCD